MITQLTTLLNATLQAKFPNASAEYLNIVEQQKIDGTYRLYTVEGNDLRQVELQDRFQLQVYHRTLGIASKFAPPEKNRGANVITEITYNQTLVFSAERSLFNDATTPEVAVGLAMLFPSILTSAQKQDIQGIEAAYFEVSTMETDPVKLWLREVGQIERNMQPERLFLAINYTAFIRANKTCFDLCLQCK